MNDKSGTERAMVTIREDDLIDSVADALSVTAAEPWAGPLPTPTS